MVASPGARRFDGDLWPAPTGDDTFEALVSSSWADPAPESSSARGKVPGPTGAVTSGGAGANGTSPPAGGLPPYLESGARADADGRPKPAGAGNGRIDRQPPYADLIAPMAAPSPSPFRAGPPPSTGQFPTVPRQHSAPPQSTPAPSTGQHPGNQHQSTGNSTAAGRAQPPVSE